MTKFQVTVDADLEPIMDRYFEIQMRELGSLEQAISAEDGETARQLGHKLKGTGTSYGFARLTELGAAIEQAGKSNDLDAARKLAGQVRSYLENVDIVFKEMG